MLTDRERLLECITCKFIEVCEIDADSLEDENGHCTLYRLDKMFERKDEE